MCPGAIGVRYVSAGLILLFLAFLVDAFAHGKIEWSFVAKFLTVPSIMFGLANTIIMSILAMALGVVLAWSSRSCVCRPIR